MIAPLLLRRLRRKAEEPALIAGFPTHLVHRHLYSAEQTPMVVLDGGLLPCFGELPRDLKIMMGCPQSHPRSS